MRLTDVVIVAVQNSLVASYTLTNCSKRLDNPQTKLAALHALVNRNVLDMADTPEAASELLLQEDRANTNNGICLARNDDQRIVGVGT